jgi:DNA polymerase-1
MRHHIFVEGSTAYSTAVLIKPAAFNKQELQTNYVHPLKIQGIPSEDVIAFTLSYEESGKAPVKFIKAYLDTLLPELDTLGIRYLYVADANYFKVLTSVTKADPHFGYALPCKSKGFEHMQVVLGLNHHQLIYNPALQSKLDMSLETLATTINGTHQRLGSNIIHSAQYPEGLDAIAKALESLHQYQHLTCDIEAFSLRFNEAGIGTCAFAWDQHNGLAFPCDYQEIWAKNGSYHPECTLDIAAYAGFFKLNEPVRNLLRNFFSTYKGSITWHNATYDVKVIIYTLWMDGLLDNVGLLEGLGIMTRDFDDTKIIAYLSTNSTAGNTLGLKSLAHEFAGNWAVEEIKDIRKIELPKLLQYNLVDALSTWYVKGKHTPVMIQDQQEDIYETLMLPSLVTIIQMELTGMPIDRNALATVKARLEAEQAIHQAAIEDSPVIKMLNLLVQNKAMKDANAKLKVKQHPLEKFSDVKFNPNSGPQTIELLYEQMGLPVIDLTDTKLPSTGAKTLAKLVNHTSNPDYQELLHSLINFGQVSKILSTFIPAFERGLTKGDGWLYLHGSFNLGGTVSGRLSSSDPNMQNIPAKSKFAKWIKECFAAPPGWLFVGADFSSLEDYISALTTKDPNKLKVYEDGYDGHCLRAYTYFKDQCPDIVDTVESINSIKKKYGKLRDESKGPTFLLTYGGTHHGMMNNLGWPLEKSKAIEKSYHDLYQVSDQYIQGRLEQASKDGFVEVAFGLRVRTPLLKQVIFGSSRMPYEAQAEGRTAGNAMGQSYCLLNNRAANAFMEKVRASKYRHDIRIAALIHDAIYLLIRDDAEVVEWTNNELIKAMEWQDLPELEHPTVKLGAALDIFWPHWGNATTLPNGADQATIRAMCQETRLKEETCHLS